ncbi:hypothetical protein CI610_00899 [invertebrate metagenome]|uniref:Uncharacterized protein n=1 Tax=invertebrate metagenome TaxID=1711999 RepID=A0A2H9TA94_9ZZZZ
MPNINGSQQPPSQSLSTTSVTSSEAPKKISPSKHSVSSPKKHIPQTEGRPIRNRSLKERAIKQQPDATGQLSSKSLQQKVNQLKTQCLLVRHLNALIQEAQGNPSATTLFKVFYVTKPLNPETGRTETKRICLIPKEAVHPFGAQQQKQIYNRLTNSLKRFQDNYPVEQLQQKLTHLENRLKAQRTTPITEKFQPQTVTLPAYRDKQSQSPLKNEQFETKYHPPASQSPVGNSALHEKAPSLTQEAVTAQSVYSSAPIDKNSDFPEYLRSYVFDGTVQGRPVIDVQLNDGRSFLMYRSSGQSTGQSSEGEWVPFPGFQGTTEGPYQRGWFIKFGSPQDVKTKKYPPELCAVADKIKQEEASLFPELKTFGRPASPVSPVITQITNHSQQSTTQPQDIQIPELKAPDGSNTQEIHQYIRACFNLDEGSMQQLERIINADNQMISQARDILSAHSQEELEYLLPIPVIHQLKTIASRSSIPFNLESCRAYLLLLPVCNLVPKDKQGQISRQWQVPQPTGKTLHALCCELVQLDENRTSLRRYTHTDTNAESDKGDFSLLRRQVDEQQKIIEKKQKERNNMIQQCVAKEALLEEENHTHSFSPAVGQLQFEITAYKRQIDVLTLQLQRDNNDLDELRTRMSQIAGAQLRDNNPAIADLSDPNRPLNIAEKFSGLYDDEWTDVLTAMENQYGDRRVIDMLKNDFINIYHVTRQHIQAFTQPFQNLPPIQRAALFERLKTPAAKKKLPGIIDYLTQHIPLSSHPKRRAFQIKCCEIATLMVIQNPPLVLTSEPERGSSLDTQFFRPYTQSGPQLDYVVWPGLYLCEGGALLFKGVAQGMGAQS